MFRKLMIAGLAMLLAACAPIPAEEPPTPVPTPQMQAGLDDFASLFAEIDSAVSDDAGISGEDYKKAILELRDCIMSGATPEQLGRMTAGEVAAIVWHIVFLVLNLYQSEGEGLIIDHLQTGLADCRRGTRD